MKNHLWMSCIREDVTTLIPYHRLRQLSPVQHLLLFRLSNDSSREDEEALALALA